MKIKKGDSVIIKTGKDKGKKGVVLKAIPKTDRLIVEGVNIVKRHLKKGSRGQTGGVIEKPSTIHISNVMLADGKAKKVAKESSAVEKPKAKRVSKKTA